MIPRVYSAKFFCVERLAEFHKYLKSVISIKILVRTPYDIQLNSNVCTNKKIIIFTIK